MILDLNKHILAKINAYQEPTRKDTPKGDPIGLSKNKYTACMLCLVKVDLHEIAKKVEVSYGLLRKWRTEKVFKDCLDVEADEVASLVMNTLMKHAKNDDQEKLKVPMHWSNEVTEKILFWMDDYMLSADKNVDELVRARFLDLLYSIFQARGDDSTVLNYYINAFAWLTQAHSTALVHSAYLTEENDKKRFQWMIDYAKDMYTFNIRLALRINN